MIQIFSAGTGYKPVPKCFLLVQSSILETICIKANSRDLKALQTEFQTCFRKEIYQPQSS